MLKDSPTFSTIRTPSSYPASQKQYFPGDRADMRVPCREITLSPTHHTDRTEENPPLPVYDTSGRYCLPGVGIGVEFIGLSPEYVRAIEEEIAGTPVIG